MAAKQEEEEAPNSLQGLACPLCLDIFDDATLLTSCGHTFCRKCLKKYDLSHQDLDHMVCPLCRKVTKLSANRVDDLLSNVSVNGLVDDYQGKCGGANVILEMRQKCNVCTVQGEAVSYCSSCNAFLCGECLLSHKLQTRFFAGHEIISMQDIIEGKASIGHSSERCSIHKQENKDMFCEECKLHVCFKCVIIGHRDHKLKSHEDFEKELQVKVNDLVQRCTAKKSELEKNIQNVEAQRCEVHTAIRKLRKDVSQAYRTKAKQLEENQRILVEQMDDLERSFDDDLNTLKSIDRQKIKSICSSIDLVANDRLGRLETDTLSAHTLLCEELESMLKKATDDTSAVVITEKIHKKRFQPADDSSLHLGNITEPEPELKVIHCVDLCGEMSGMTNYAGNSVAIGYYDVSGITIIGSNGGQQGYVNTPNSALCFGFVFQRDRTLCISTSIGEAYICSPKGSRISAMNVDKSFFRLSKSPSDEILIIDCSSRVYIYDPTLSRLKQTVLTKQNVPMQAYATKAGLIVTSSCDSSYRSMVSVYDRNGNAGMPLCSPNYVYLYAAVDEQDRVYVASVDGKNSKVVIRLYDLDGLNLKERVQFKALNLNLNRTWCYLLSLSPELLAFAFGKKLYFIKVVM